MSKGLATLQAEGGLLAVVSHLVQEQEGNLNDVLGPFAANAKAFGLCAYAGLVRRKLPRVSCPCVNIDGAVV